MKIETKFDVGDKCYFMYSNAICEGEIEEIRIGVSGENDIEIRYSVSLVLGGGVSSITQLESDLFKTKEELVEDLLKQ